MTEMINADAERQAPCAGLRIGDVAPDFSARTTAGDVRLSDYRGQWLILFSHPADFTPVCTTEFVALAQAASDFEQRDCALVALCAGAWTPVSQLVLKEQMCVGGTNRSQSSLAVPAVAYVSKSRAAMTLS